MSRFTGAGMMIMRLVSNRFLPLMIPLCLLITSCGKEVPFPRCVSADNFSSDTTTSVSAHFAEGDIEAFKAENKEIGNGTAKDATKQVVRWKDTGYVTDGKEIIIKITGGWVPWAKNGARVSPIAALNIDPFAAPENIPDQFYEAVIDMDRICGPYEERQQTLGDCVLKCQHIPTGDAPDSGKYGKPCWLEKGYGAYLLFKRPDDPDPNLNLDVMEYPSSPTTHLGHTTAAEGGQDTYYSSGKVYSSTDCQPIALQRGWKVYVKILDSYYHDNVGGYVLEFTQGVIKGGEEGIFEYVRKLVRKELDSAGKEIFKRITENKQFKNFAFAVMTLFLVFTALLYLLGMVQSPFPDLIVRILKMVLVILLVSPGSWDFFYNHLLKLFINGVDEIIVMVNSYAVKQDFKSDQPFAFMDVMIRKIFSTSVWYAKARALITASWWSLLALACIVLAVLVYLALCAYAFIIYLTAFVGITFLTALMPLFFVGILFSRFRTLFDGWLTQCISFSMQAILMFTLLAMFAALIMHYYYRIFGFTACYNEWLIVDIRLGVIKIFSQKYYEWTPGQKYDPYIIGYTDGKHRKNTTSRFEFTGGGAVIKVPPDYQDEDFRYVDFPFLDPDTNSSTVPGGVVLKKTDEKFKKLGRLVNSLVVSESGGYTARLVTKVKTELEELAKGGVITDEKKDKFLEAVKKREEEDKKKAKKTGDSAQKNVKERYKDQKFKQEMIDILVKEVISSDSEPATPLSDLRQQHDYDIIHRIRHGEILMLFDMFGLMLVAFLVWQMRAFVQHVAIVLAGGGMLSRTVAGMYDEGFTRIFSHIPGVGKLFEVVDRGIDSLKLIPRAGIDSVTSFGAKAPEKTLGKIPIIGGVMGAMAGSVRHVAGAFTTAYNEEDLHSIRSISPRFDYARAWIGAHLGYSPLDAMKYLTSHTLDIITGDSQGGLIHNIQADHEAFLANLRSLTVGLDKHQPSLYVPNKKKDEEEENPFAPPGVRDLLSPDGDRQAGGTPPSLTGEEVSANLPARDNVSFSLFDSAGNLHVDRDNVFEAVSALHGLNVMKQYLDDDRALEKTEDDVRRMESEISDFVHNNPGEVPEELRQCISESGDIDFAAMALCGARHGREESQEVVEGVVCDAGIVVDDMLESAPPLQGEDTARAPGIDGGMVGDVVQAPVDAVVQDVGDNVAVTAGEEHVDREPSIDSGGVEEPAADYAVQDELEQQDGIVSVSFSPEPLQEPLGGDDDGESEVAVAAREGRSRVPGADRQHDERVVEEPAAVVDFSVQDEGEKGDSESVSSAEETVGEDMEQQDVTEAEGKGDEEPADTVDSSVQDEGEKGDYSQIEEAVSEDVDKDAEEEAVTEEGAPEGPLADINLVTGEAVESEDVMGLPEVMEVEDMLGDFVSTQGAQEEADTPQHSGKEEGSSKETLGLEERDRKEGPHEQGKDKKVGEREKDKFDERPEQKGKKQKEDVAPITQQGDPTGGEPGRARRRSGDDGLRRTAAIMDLHSEIGALENKLKGELSDDDRKSVEMKLDSLRAKLQALYDSSIE